MQSGVLSFALDSKCIALYIFDGIFVITREEFEVKLYKNPVNRVIVDISTLVYSPNIDTFKYNIFFRWPKYITVSLATYSYSRRIEETD